MNKLSEFEKRIIFGTLTFCVALFGLVFAKLYNVEQDLKEAQTQISEQSSLLFNEIDIQKSLLRPIVDAENKTVIIPEVGIKLPYNDITKTLQYSYEGGENGFLRITSTLISDRESNRQLGCSELAIVDFDNGDPINPWTESGGSTVLDDGRTLYIVSPIAYENNEGSTLDCKSEVWLQINPEQVREELKKAEAL